MSQSGSVLLSSHMKKPPEVASPGSGGSGLDHFTMAFLSPENPQLPMPGGGFTPLPADGMPSCEVILQRGLRPETLRHFVVAAQ